MRLLARWVVTAAAVAAAVLLVPGIDVAAGSSTLLTLAVVAVFLGFVNAIIRPILQFLSCGLIVATLGLFILVINAGTLMLASSWANVIPGVGLSIEGFWPAFWGGIVISVVSFLLSVFIPEPDYSNDSGN
ncbi:MAG: phage holin family protein [Coriobacteriia bacterium]|nr:phage holin family protein [Coriobacteriia bacterium]